LNGDFVTGSHPHANELAAFTMILLRCEDRYLMLKRSENKAFAPGRWTGIGGRVELHEMADLRASALRELDEETGIQPEQVRNLTLRRALLQHRPGHAITTLLYFTGELDELVTPRSDEGSLHWLLDDELESIDIIENTRQVIPLLIEDMTRDPGGREGLRTGAMAFSSDDQPRQVIWST
jgi:8-oxo-dGTP diphosphatase